MVGLVSLVVIGPKNLPKAARITGFWLGKLSRMVTSVKAEIKEELQLDEIRQNLLQQAALEDLNETLSEVKQASQNLKDSIDSVPK